MDRPSGSGTLALTCVPVWGQGGPLLDPGLGSLVGNIGIVGILVWHLWYHTTHSYPRMMDAFRQEIESIRQRAAEDLAAVRDSFHKEQGETRAMLIETLQAMRRAVHDVRDTAQATVRMVEEKSHEKRQP